MNEQKIIDLGYDHPKLLASGEWAALYNFLFTVGLLVGIDEVGYRTRFCYPNRPAAEAAITQWDGHGDPPGPWIKEKGIGIERSNPRTFSGIPVVVEV